MKANYVKPEIEVILVDVERHLCDASKGRYDLGKEKENNEQGNIIVDYGNGPGVTSAKKVSSWNDDWSEWQD